MLAPGLTEMNALSCILPLPPTLAGISELQVLFLGTTHDQTPQTTAATSYPRNVVLMK